MPRRHWINSEYVEGGTVREAHGCPADLSVAVVRLGRRRDLAEVGLAVVVRVEAGEPAAVAPGDDRPCVPVVLSRRLALRRDDGVGGSLDGELDRRRLVRLSDSTVRESRTTESPPPAVETVTVTPPVGSSPTFDTAADSVAVSPALTLSTSTSAALTATWRDGDGLECRLDAVESSLDLEEAVDRFECLPAGARSERRSGGLDHPGDRTEDLRSRAARLGAPPDEVVQNALRAAAVRRFVAAFVGIYVRGSVWCTMNARGGSHEGAPA